MTTKGKISTKQRAAIASLLTESSVKDAAAKAGIGERTLHRWLKESKYEAFQAAYDAAQNEAVERAVARLAGELQPAIRTLSTIHQDTEQLASSRIRAASVILAEFRHQKEFNELEQRIAQLEEQLSNG